MNLLANEHADHPLRKLAEANPAIAKAVGYKPNGKTLKPAKCPHLKEDTGRTVACIDNCGKGWQLKVFGCDLHGECTQAKRGADVAACCGNCPDNPLKPRDPWKNLITIPEPPPLELSFAPRSRLAVVTVVTGRSGQELFGISHYLMTSYAKRVKADFVRLEWPGVVAWPMSSKFTIARVLDHYERVIYLDADVLVHPEAPDLFNEVPVGRLGAYNDLPELLMIGGAAQLIEEYQKVRETQSLQRCPVPYYVNTGILVFDRSHRSVLGVPANPIPPLHCSEQHCWVANMQTWQVKLHLLPKWANYQWWSDKTLVGVPRGCLLHFSGMQYPGGPADRLKLMAWWAHRFTIAP